MAYRSPSATNTFIPSWDSTKVLVQATRNQDEFKLARYIQYVPTKTKWFRYLKLDMDEPARVVATNEFVIAPGQAMDTGPNNIGAFTFVDSSTLKYSYGWVLPDEAIDQAEWDLRGSQMGIIHQKAMTVRTMKVAAKAQTSSNWPSTNTDMANNLNSGAGKWDTASNDPADTKYLAIKKTLDAAALKVVLQTNAVMKYKDLVLVIGPELAMAMGKTSEMYQPTVHSPDAFARQKGDEQFTSEFGVPSVYAGVKIEVEDAVKVTSRPNVNTGLATSGTRGFVWAAQTPVLMSRKGGIEGKYGGSPLSTIQLYHYRDMEVFTKDDVDNERKLGRIVDDFSAEIPFGQSGVCIQQAV